MQNNPAMIEETELKKYAEKELKAFYDEQHRLYDEKSIEYNWNSFTDNESDEWEESLQVLYKNLQIRFKELTDLDLTLEYVGETCRDSDIGETHFWNIKNAIILNPKIPKNLEFKIVKFVEI